MKRPDIASARPVPICSLGGAEVGHSHVAYVHPEFEANPGLEADAPRLDVGRPYPGLLLPFGHDDLDCLQPAHDALKAIRLRTCRPDHLSRCESASLLAAGDGR
ncbi:hypothetical protein [Methylobacterium sp. P1-11]|uniref:hypothetical protein n=1 Tax=Methylobacterium sp. P1-11 TaxID=2024616 RepID=UPI0011EE0007|nr:hypothetical protein [Methylobacterium sp. P1-11]